MELSSPTLTAIQDRREATRYEVSLRCKLVLAGHEVPATIEDISLGGAAIHVAPSYETSFLRSLSCIRIAELGTVGAQMRWRQASRMGVAFVPDPLMRKAITAFLADRKPRAKRD